MQSTVTLYPGDNRISLQRLIDEGVRVHSVVTDPPYGLVSIEKRFGKKGAAAARTEGNDGSFARLSAGFIGRTWDGTGIERDPEFWRLIHDILLPGGFCFAFSGARTGHWQACAMEAAGFIMHPFHVWAYGSGFPKAKDVEKELVKAGFTDEELLAEWAGWKFGTQSQKPAVEPIYLAQRPISEKTYIANIKKHGVGAVNIDACRVPLDSDTKAVVRAEGRHPSNLILDGSPEVVAMFPNESDRFFHQFTPDADPLFYHPKAGKQDRASSNHPTVKPIALMQYLIRHITPPGGVVLDPFAGSGTTAEAARREGFDVILMEAEQEYVDFLNQRFNLGQVERSDSLTDLTDLLDNVTNDLLV